MGHVSAGKGTGRSIARAFAPGVDELPAYIEWLEAGDRYCFYTDGVTEGRAADGSRFGTRTPSAQPRPAAATAA
jgi:serine phosphatase RsbU (regulator of sigma subunit)